MPGRKETGSHGAFRVLATRMVSLLRRFFSLLLIAAIAAVPLKARADDPLARVVNGLTFDQFVAQTLRDYAVPGAVVAIAAPNGPLLVKGYGIRKAGESAAVDADTRFQIASMSKCLAGTAIGTVIDRGAITWDQPVRSLNPDLVLAEPYAARWVTLRDFLAMRSGIPAYGADILTRFGLSAAQLVNRVRYLPPEESFRSRWLYSNYGIFLALQSAAHTVGLSAPELLDQGLLTPLGMTRSGPSSATLDEDSNRSFSHNVDGSLMPTESVDSFVGAGAIVSTGADIAKWMQMLLARGSYEGKQILKPTTVDQIFAASMVMGNSGPLHDPNGAAGLGCESYHFLQYRVIEKNGALNGIRTLVTLIPEKNVGIAIFSNKQLTVFPEAIRAEFLERYIGPSGVDLQAQIHKEQKGWLSLLARPQPPADAKPPGHARSAYTGTYVSHLYGTLRITNAAGTLAAAIGPHGYPGHLMHYSGDAYLLWFDDPDVQAGLLTFKFDGAGSVREVSGSLIPGTLTVSYGAFSPATTR